MKMEDNTMKTKFDRNQLDTIDVLIGNLLDAREAEDDDSLELYAGRLNSFLTLASGLQDRRSRAQKTKEPETRWIVLKSFGFRKINVIKQLRECVPGLGLKEAKRIVERAPIGLSREIPEITDTLLDELLAAGAFVQVTTHKPQHMAVDVQGYFDRTTKELGL